jgi:AcrR family transcriptional regulator
MRADAQRNRRLLLDAACHVFIESGTDAALGKIALRAGIGIATLYRHFPDRRALVTAVAVDVMARTGDEARAALAEEPDAFEALRRYMHRALQVCTPAVMPLLDDTVRDAPEVAALRDSSAAAQADLIAAAKQQGLLRQDIEFADIGFALARFSRPLGAAFDPDLESDLAHRHLEIYIDGLRDHRAGPLAGPELTLRDLRTMLRRHGGTQSAKSRRK